MTSADLETPSVFLVTDVTFWTGHRGSCERISAMFDYLNTFCDVTVCFVGELAIEEWNRARRKLNCELIGPGMPGKIASTIVEQVSKLHNKPASVLPAGESSEQVALQDFHSNVISTYIGEQVRKRQPDVVLLEYVTMAYLCKTIRTASRQPLLMVDTHDLMHLRCNAFEALGLKHWLTLDKDEEVTALDQADVVLAIQERDAALLADLLPDREVCLVKHAAMCDVPVIKPTEGEFAIGLVSSSGIANLSSLNAFLENCWSTIRDALGNKATLKVGGYLTAEQLGNSVILDGVEFVGPFANAAAFYAPLDIAINPAVIPSGLKIKSLQALSYSVPLVTTRAGIAGLENAIDVCAVVADNWQHFAESIIRFGNDRDLVNSMAENCKRFVNSEFSADVVYAELRQVIQNARRRKT